MGGLHGLAWRGLRARRMRTGLTIAGVTLGVAVLFAGLATNAGIEAAVDRAVTTLVGRADLRVATFGEAGLSDATLETIVATPGVAVAAPAFERRTYLGAEAFGPGDPLPPPVTIAGIDPPAEAALHDLTLREGTPLSGEAGNDALVTATLAREDGLVVGDTIEIETIDAPARLRVAGILADDGPWAGGGGRAVIVPLETAQTIFGADGLTRIDIGTTSAAAVTDALESTLLSEPYVLSSPRDLGASMRASTGDFAATTALIGAIALFTGAFLIFNSLSMTVVERVRELGLLRAAGASRGQLTAYILVQAAAVGIAGSLLGIALGAVLAGGIAAWVRTVGSVVLGAPVVTPGDGLAAFAIGLVVTLAAAIEPARRAGRISPVEALKARLDPPTARRARLRWLIAVFALVGVVGLLIWPRGAGEAALVRALLVYAVLLAVALAVPFILPAMARIAGAPFALLVRFEERLARATLLRDRARAALTVGALTIGLAMIVALGGVGQNARIAAGAWIADVVPGELVLTSIFPRGLDELEDVLVTAGVVSVSPIGTFALAVDGVRMDGVAMVGADLANDGRLRFTAGDRAAALAAIDAGGAVIVPASVAGRDGLALDMTIEAAAADGSVLPLRVVGIAERTLPGPTGESLIVGWTDAERLGVAGADAFAVRFGPSATPADRAELSSVARSVALEPTALGRIEGAIGQALDRVFGLFDVLALVAVVVAGLGIVNTLTMNVFERVREIGVLRAAGMTRRQVWRSVVVEAGITGLVGAICGVAAGLIVGGLMVVLAGGRWEIATAVPWTAVATAFALGVLLAMLAAAYPARLASRVSIVRAPAPRPYGASMTIALPRLDRSTAAERGITLADFLVPISVGERLGTRIRHMTLIAAGALFVILCARIVIPTTPVPFTGQTFGVLLVGGALGLRRGLAALLLYVAIGAIGIPVYAQDKAGIAIIQGATGGYLIGFVVAAAVVGRLAELGWDRRIGGSLAAMAIGTAIIYAIGVPWLKVTTGLSWPDAVGEGMTKFLVWDAAKLAVAAGIFPAAWWLIGRRPDDR